MKRTPVSNRTAAWILLAAGAIGMFLGLVVLPWLFHLR